MPARRCLAFLGVLFLASIAGPTVAGAHVVDSAGYSTVRQDGAAVSYLLSLEYDVLAKAVDLGPAGTAATDDTQRAAALEAGSGALTRYLDERVVVSLDGAGCEPALRGSSIGRRGETPYADLELRFSCPGSEGSHRLRYDVFAESEAVADGHTNVVDYQFGERSGRTVLDRQHQDFSVGESSMLTSGVQFGQLGVKHILLGLDHVLFVVALILGAAAFRDLLKVTATFTVAHSVTLVSTLLGGIDVPAIVVEPLIALSIAFVAAENLLGATRHRLPVVFGFGLLHGLGFAGSLRITDEVSTNLLVSLLSFNVGIEVGQALLLAAVFPLLLLVRRTRISVPLTRAATGVVAAFGLYWFIERFFFA